MTRAREGGRGVRIYVAGLGLVAVAAWTWLVPVRLSQAAEHPLLFALFTALILLGELVSIKIPRDNGTVDEITTSATFSFSLLLAVGIGPSVLAQALASVIADAFRRKPLVKTAFNAIQYTVALSVAGLILRGFGRPGALTGDPLTPLDGLGLLLAGAAFSFTSSTLTNIAIALEQGEPPLSHFGLDLPFQGFTDLILLALAPVVVLVARDHLALTPLLALPMFAVARSAQGSVRNAQLAEELRQQAQQNEHLALHDALTGLPNRTLFRQSVDLALRQAQRERHTVAVLLLDLDRFKEINDTLGHHWGDIALKEVSARLRDALRDSDVVARLGGDEFGILLTKVEGEAGAFLVARKVMECLEGPLSVEHMQLDVTASVGIVLFPDHQAETDADELMRKADVAMYAAKERGLDHCHYRPDLDRYSSTRLTLVGDLRQAVDEGQLMVHYQPKAVMATGQITGVEALVRWIHPRLGVVKPNQFIPLAETTGLVRQLTRRVLSLSLAQTARWKEAGLDLSVAVNLSAHNLMDADFPQSVERMLDDAGLEAGDLELEITESSIMRDPNRATDILGCLHEMGVGLSIDDFGTGYSSLAYLRRLPVQSLKIDRGFVMNLESNLNDEVIVRSTIEMARNLGLQVVAEGVESLTIWHRLAAFGCDQAQGYFLTRPIPGSAIAPWLSSWTPPVPEPRPTLLTG